MASYELDIGDQVEVWLDITIKLSANFGSFNLWSHKSTFLKINLKQNSVLLATLCIYVNLYRLIIQVLGVYEMISLKNFFLCIEIFVNFMWNARILLVIIYSKICENKMFWKCLENLIKVLQ